MQIKSPAQQMAEQFDAEHGESITSPCGSWILYADGASREIDPRGAYRPLPELRNGPFYGRENKRPELELEIIRRRLRFHEAKVHHLVREHRKRLGRMHGTNYTDDEFAELERLSEQVEKAQLDLEDVMREKEKHPYYASLRARDQSDQEDQQRINEKSQALMNMRI